MKVNLEVYSQSGLQIFQNALKFAARMGHGYLGSEHLLWALAKEGGRSARLLKQYGLDDKLVEEYIRRYDGSAAGIKARAIQISGEADEVLGQAQTAAKARGHEKTGPEDILAGILSTGECAAVQLLWSLGVNTEEMKKELPVGEEEYAAEEETVHTQEEEEEGESYLEKYGSDMTRKAEEGQFDPVIGRDDVVERLVQVLSRRTKNNPVLIGDPGVGKTAVVEGLAQRIASGRIPLNLKHKKIIAVDLVGMISGTRFRGDFEERMKAFLGEAQEDEDIILFIDELHTIMGAGAGTSEAMDAANILKPVLARGDLQIIGATTGNEYRQHIEKDAALERRFQPVSVEEPDVEDTVEILEGLKKRYEDFHGLTITDEAVRAAAQLSARYIQDRFLPDKAIDLLDEAASRIRTRGMTEPPQLQELDDQIAATQKEKKAAAQAQAYERAAVLRDRQNELERTLKERQEAWQKSQKKAVDAQDIAAVVSAWTGIPVTMLTMDEKERLRSLETILHQRVVGQDEAVKAVAQAIRRGRTGVADPGRPMGSFLFLGPTGVGKTELCRALAEAMFQDENAMIRLDMSEYMESYTVSKLIGSPPGYVGHDEGGQLTEQVRKHPYSIVLFDEIEKAHPDVWNALLQILDDGRLTDSQGRTVSFKNTIIVLTSNVGARDILGKKSLGFVQSDKDERSQRDENIRSRVMEEVKRTFQPEFLNRLDEIIVFHQLEEKDVRQIAGHMTEQFARRLEGQGVHLRITDQAVDVLAQEGFDPVYGARPLRRAIQSALQNKVADKLLEEDFDTDEVIVVDAKGDDLRLTVSGKESDRERETALDLG